MPLLRNLAGLIDFESAARWGSFRLAAQELHKTPAAVSQQIKNLEQALGFPLFARYARRVVLTTQGKVFAHAVGRALADLNGSLAALQAQDDEHTLRVSSTHSFSIKWLAPRLPRFTAHHPTIDLRIESSDRMAEMRDGSCDVAIRYGRYQPSEKADCLGRESLVVVFSPSLCDATIPLASLVRYPLLYEDNPALWLQLLSAQGVAHRHFDFSARLSHSGLLVQAAVAGQGVALVPHAIAYEDLSHGRLLRANCPPIASEYGYWLLGAPAKADSPKVMQFKAWLHAEFAEMAAKLESRSP